MSFTYDVSTDALRGLASIADYEAAFKEPAAVNQLVRTFVNAFHTLCENPFSHQVYEFQPPLATLHEYRTVNVEKYKVFYWVEHKRVHIFRIRHLKSDFTRLPL